LTEQAHDDGTLERPVTVKDIMDTWTLKKGYPIVTITRNARTLNIKQRYFLLNPLNSIQNTPEYDTYKWYIAFTYTTKDELDWDFEKTPNWFMPKDPQCKLKNN
jgi:aminopeptidase N